MINFRYHIVSLTAVLLALGIGLMLGTTFLDQATVDALKDRQAELESDVRRTNDRNSDQAAAIDEYEREASAFSEQIGERLFSGILRNDPVLVIATKGVDQGQVDSVDGGDDPGRRPARGCLVAHRPAQARRRQRGRRHGRRAAAQHQRPRPPAHVACQPAGRGPLRGQRPAARPGGRPTSQGALGTAEDGGEPPLVARLVEGGFVDYQQAEGSDDDVVVAAHLRPAGRDRVGAGRERGAQRGRGAGPHRLLRGRAGARGGGRAQHRHRRVAGRARPRAWSSTSAATTTSPAGSRRSTTSSGPPGWPPPCWPSTTPTRPTRSSPTTGWRPARGCCPSRAGRVNDGGGRGDPGGGRVGG